MWYAQSALINRYNAVIAMSTATKQFPDNNDDVISSTAMQSHSKDQETAAPSHTDTPSSDNAQNHNTITDTAIRYNADGSIDTSNWQEYCNQEYGFCVKYPQGWEVEKKRYTIKGVDGVFRYIVLQHNNSKIRGFIGIKKAGENNIFTHPFRTGIPSGRFIQQKNRRVHSIPAFSRWDFYNSDGALEEAWFCGNGTSPNNADCHIVSRSGKIVEAMITEFGTSFNKEAIKEFQLMLTYVTTK